MDYEVIENDTDKGNGTQMLFKTDKPVSVLDFEGDEKVTTQYFVSSATTLPIGGCETYIFPANENGDIIDWGELPGSTKGTMNCEAIAEKFMDQIDNSKYLKIKDD